MCGRIRTFEVGQMMNYLSYVRTQASAVVAYNFWYYIDSNASLWKFLIICIFYLENKELQYDLHWDNYCNRTFFEDTLFPVCLALTIPFGGDLILRFTNSFDVVKYGMIQVLHILEDFYLRYFLLAKVAKINASKHKLVNCVMQKPS